FSSGVDHVQWIFVGGMVAGADGSPTYRVFFVPRRHLSIIDDWHVAGLRGTGSKSVELEDVVVPARRSLRLSMARTPMQPDDSAIGDNSMYRIPWAVTFQWAFVAAALGSAQGML